jgi:exosortase
MDAFEGEWVDVTHGDGVRADFHLGKRSRNPRARSARRMDAISPPSCQGYTTMSASSLPASQGIAWKRLILPVILPAALAVLTLWAFAPTLAELAHRWSNDSQYSHGYLVPGFSLILLWLRRERCAALTAGGGSWWGAVLLTLGVALRFAGDYLYLDWLDAAALLPCLAGLALLLGGWAALRWAWPAIAFLVFMIPLPFRVEIALAHPLQRIATLASTYALQTIGLPALSEGNTILINETRIGVVEACSGLSMLVIFFALSTAFGFLAPRPLWQRVLLAASAVPIALIANITRITVTGLMHETVGHKAADLVFHDLAGWLMMPFALVLLWLELKALGRMFLDAPIVETASKNPVVPGIRPPAPATQTMRRRRAKDRFVPPMPHGPRRS